MIELASHLDHSVGKSHNLAAWIRRGERIVLMLADAAESEPDAAFAAQFAIKAAMKYAGRETQPLGAGQWLKIVGEVDVPLSLEPSGRTTLAVADIGQGRISGASVGDSKVFVLDKAAVDLTADQQRTPLLGSGDAVARAFEAGWDSGTVLVCSDGLHKYAAREKLIAAAPGMDAEAMVEAARLPNGKLFDDAAVVLVRRGKGATAALPEGTIQYIQSS